MGRSRVYSRPVRSLLCSWLLVPGWLSGGQCPWSCPCLSSCRRAPLGGPRQCRGGWAWILQVWFVLLPPAHPRAHPAGSAPAALMGCPSERGRKWARLTAVRPGRRWQAKVAGIPRTARRARPGREAQGRAVWWAVRSNRAAWFTEKSPLRMRRGGCDDWLAGVAERRARHMPDSLGVQ